MDQKNLTKLIFYAIFFAMSVYLILSYTEVIWEDMFVAYGTIILAFFTWNLAQSEIESSSDMRQLMIDEAYHERRKVRIKEQLEGLYSLLIAHRDLFVEGNYEHTKEVDIDPFMAKYFIKGKYEFLASQKLKVLFREYFRLSSPDIRMDRDNWIRLMKEIKKCIDVDFHYLIQEYNDLTKHLIP